MAESQNRGTCSSLKSRTISNKETLRACLRKLDEHPAAKVLAKTFAPHGELCHVGGSVRDAVLGREVHDLDFSTELDPQTILKILNGASIRSLEMSAKHGTIIAVIDGASYEITQFRDAQKSCVGDLGLRDFTINAMAYLAVSSAQNNSEVFDPLGGLKDLESGIIRACGDQPAERFKEDPLRILRAIRFGPAQGFVIEENTKEAIQSLVAKLESVSPERIRDELEKILLSEHPRDAFKVMHELGILAVILPEILPSIGSEQNEWHTEDVFEHTLTVIERAELERIQRWCALFHDLGKPATTTVDEEGRRHFYGHEKVSESIALEVTKRLRFSIDDQRLIALLVRQHMRPINVGESGVRRILRDLGDAYDGWRKFKWADAPPAMEEAAVLTDLAKFDQQVKAEINRPKGSVYSALAIDGNDLITIGFKAGPGLGAELKALHEIVIEDPNSNEREILLRLAKEHLEK